LVIQ